MATNANLSFGEYPVELAEQVLKICDFSSFIGSQLYRAEEFVSMRKMPTRLDEEVFAALAEQMDVHEFPTQLNESDVNCFANAFLTPIVKRVKSESGAQLTISGNVKIPECPDSSISDLENSYGWADFVMQRKPEVSSKLTRLVIIELKKGTIEAAYIQCMLYMLEAFEQFFKIKKQPENDDLSEPNSSKDGRLIYGLCTNGVHMNAISYDGEKFRMLFERTIMFPGMHRKEKCTVERDGRLVEEEQYPLKKYWMERHSEMVGIVYSCLWKVVSEVNE